jgi:LemA protein
VVKQYNEKIVVFPNNVIAGMFSFKPQEYFEVQEAERENVEVKF